MTDDNANNRFDSMEARKALKFGASESSLWRWRNRDGDSVYLRFHSDGTVIHAFTGDSPERIKRWFQKPFNYSGTYSIRGLLLKFSIDTMYGPVDFDGAIEDDSLQLTEVNHKSKETDTYRYQLVEEPPIAQGVAVAVHLPDVTGELTKVDLFQLLGDRPIASNVAAIFAVTRRSVGGAIRLVDLYFENGIVLRNVRIVSERVVTIPGACTSMPIETVGVADLGRHEENPPMRAEMRL